MKRTRTITKILAILLMAIFIINVNAKVVYCDPDDSTFATQEKLEEDKKAEESQQGESSKEALGGATESMSTSDKLKKEGKVYTGQDDSTVDANVGKAKEFIENGEKESEINQKQLIATSNFLYNLLLGIGIIVVVVIGVILGIKFMIGSLEEKAEIKQHLVGYVIGCIVLFGAFGIWRIVVLLMKGI